MTERPGTGTCDVEAVRRPSLSVFYKEKREKVLKTEFLCFRCVLNRTRGNCCVDSVNIQPEAAQVPSTSHTRTSSLWSKTTADSRLSYLHVSNSKNVTGTAKNCLILEI